MSAGVAATVGGRLGQDVLRAAPIGGRADAPVWKLTLADGRTVAAKLGRPGAGLQLEAAMLAELRDQAGLPTPEVLRADDDLLVMAYVETAGGIDAAAERHAAELIAGLHAVGAAAFGFDYDTPIGGVMQPNAWSDSWRGFFAEQRLLAMGRMAHGAGRLPAATLARIERLAGRLERWIDEPERPSLVHGDLWTGNVLTRNGRVAAVIDPSIHYADPEIELAFTTLFGTFGEAFFRRYDEIRPLRAGFFEARRDLYNLYPLLVHVRLFGGGYLAGIERTLTRFGV